MNHTCPKCSAPCECEADTLYGDCEHDCEAWRAEGCTDPMVNHVEPDDYFEREGE